jgi:hypothetical protein
MSGIYKLSSKHHTPSEKIQAAQSCLAAKPTISSGAMTATSIILSLLQKSASRLWLGGGTFGCTETQVHAKMVAKQPQTMSNSLRQLLISSQESTGARESRGRPCERLDLWERMWTPNNNRSIALPGSRVAGLLEECSDLRRQRI